VVKKRRWLTLRQRYRSKHDQQTLLTERGAIEALANSIAIACNCGAEQDWDNPDFLRRLIFAFLAGLF
jgi:hypothetical protein